MPDTEFIRYAQYLQTLFALRDVQEELARRQEGDAAAAWDEEFYATYPVPPPLRDDEDKQEG